MSSDVEDESMFPLQARRCMQRWGIEEEKNVN